MDRFVQLHNQCIDWREENVAIVVTNNANIEFNDIKLSISFFDLMNETC